jgi:hypothetical protein
MPAGSACKISGVVQVLSPVTLGAGSALLVASGGLTVQGSLTVGRKAAFGADFKSETAPVTILGSVHVQKGAAFFLGTEVPYGPIFATIQGSVSGRLASAVVIQNTYIGGSASISGGGADNKTIDAITGGPGNNYTDFEDDHIKGPVSEVGYGGIWAGVIRTIVTGPLTFAYNSEQTIDEYDIGSDIIKGSAFCQGNNPAPNMGGSRGSPSTVLGPTFGDQARTCTGVVGGGTGPTPH